MRKVLITVAAAASAFAVAAPAAAQYYPAPPPPPPYGYGQPYGYQPGYNQPYGYNAPVSWGQVRALQARVDNLQRRIDRLAARRLITRNERNGLRSESRAIERRLRIHSQYGLTGRERYDIERRIARLEQHVRHEVRDGRRGWQPYVYGPEAYGYYDRDRDGRDDRWENDRGRERD